MGVQRLTALLTRFAPQSLRKTDASAFAHQTLVFDASCHLNRFMYGDDVHPHRHVHGFYLLARFCDLNNIKPIFVFDGPHRLAAKQLEHARRERGRRKTNFSLILERERSARLDYWLELSEEDCRRLTNGAAERLLSQLGETLHVLKDEHHHHQQQEVESVEHRSEQWGLCDEDKDSLDKQQELESRITEIAQGLRAAMISIKDTEKYTKTVRALSSREYDLSAAMIRDKLRNVKNALHELRADSHQMLASLEKRSIRVTQQLRDECREFLEAQGYRCFSCEHHEAEAMCAHMCKAGWANATVSEDMDTLVFGDSPVLRYFFARNKAVLSVDPVVAREQLGLTRDSFIDLCILCGTDFSSTIQGIGPIRALQLIQRHGSIEHVLKHLDTNKYVPHENFDYELARKVFNGLPSIPMDEAAYQAPRVDHGQSQLALAQYDIDSKDAAEKLQLIMLQQSISVDRGGDPFATSTIQRL